MENGINDEVILAAGLHWSHGHGSAQLPIDNAERGLDAELATQRKNDSRGILKSSRINDSRGVLTGGTIHVLEDNDRF
jgi:hypothetical protein